MKMTVTITEFALVLLFLGRSVFAAELASVRIAPGDSIRAFLDADSAKLVFEDEGYLYCIDFSTATPGAIRLNNTAGGILPCISPDGRWLAFNTGVAADNVRGPAKAWLLRLDGNADALPAPVDSPAFMPRFYRDTGGLYVTYTDRGGLNLFDSSSCRTLRCRVADGVAQGPAVDLTGHGGYPGGLSKDGGTLASETQKAWMLNLLTSARSQVHRITMQNTVTGLDTIEEPQICNTSISQSDLFLDAMMYLDFGRTSSVRRHSVLGNWAFHQIIFISTSDNTIWKAYRAPYVPPTGAYGSINKIEWDDAEWSTHPCFGVAGAYIRRCYESCLQDRNRRERLYFINLKDSVYRIAVETTDTAYSSTVNMQWPALWVNTAGFTEAPGWLTAKGPIGPAVENNAAPLKRNAGVRFLPAARTVVSSLPVRSVCLFDVNGRLLYSMDGQGRVRLILPAGAMGPLPAGFRLVCVKTSDGSVSVLPWMVVK